MIEFTQSDRQCRALTKLEADDEGLDYVYWKDCPPMEGLGWILTDDGYVLALRSCRTYEKGSSSCKFVRAWGGCAWATEKMEFNFTDFHANGRYNDTNPEKSWDELEAGKNRTKRAVDVLLASYMSTGKFDWHRAGRVYRPDEEIPEATLKRLFRKQSIRKMITEELRAMYDDIGLDEKWTAEKVKKAGEIAEEKEDPLNMLRAAQEAQKLLGMEPGIVRAERTESLEDGQKLLKRAESFTLEGHKSD